MLQHYPAFQQYSRNGLDLDLHFHKAAELPQNVLDWAFTLCKSNMEAFYNGAWGWNDATKKEELAASEARFLLAYKKVGIQPWAVAHSNPAVSNSMQRAEVVLEDMPEQPKQISKSRYTRCGPNSRAGRHRLLASFFPVSPSIISEASDVNVTAGGENCSAHAMRKGLDRNFVSAVLL